MSKCVFFVAAFIAANLSVVGQTYVFSTLAGMPSLGSTDGPGGMAQFRFPCSVGVDRNGNVFVADTDNHTIRKITPAGVVSTYAGAPGRPGNDDGPATAARFTSPVTITLDRADNLYVAANNAVRRISPDGIVSTVARQFGSAGTTGGALIAFLYPGNEGGLAVDEAGNLFVSDTTACVIRKITPQGEITVFAGRATEGGFVDGSGQAARFLWPKRLAIDHEGNLFVVDTGNNAIRKISSAGVVTTVIRQAQFRSPEFLPQAVALDSVGNLYVSNYGPQNWDGYPEAAGTIQKFTPTGERTILAGSSLNYGATDGPGDVALFSYPAGIAVDVHGNVFVADTTNSAIRKITPDGSVSTVAGVSPNFAEGPGSTARFREPLGLALDSAGNLYVADGGNHRVRKVSPAGVVSTLAGSYGGHRDGPADMARFNYPHELAIDSQDNVWVVDANIGIRRIAPDGSVSTPVRIQTSQIAFDPSDNLLAVWGNAIYRIGGDGAHTLLAGHLSARGSVDGTGNAARFLSVWDFVVAADGRAFALEYEGHTIRSITPDGVVTTVAGQAGFSDHRDGDGTEARFDFPTRMILDRAGNLFVTEPNRRAIRKVTGQRVTTLKTTLSPDFTIGGIAVDKSGVIYVSDSVHHCILKGVPTATIQSNSRLTNLSFRASLQPDQPMVSVIRVTGRKSVLARAVGPGLRPFLPDATLASNPRIDLLNAAGVRVESNDDWSGSLPLREAFVAAGAFALDAGSTDAALLRTLESDGTLHVSSATSGTALLEIFDLGRDNDSRITSVHTRHPVSDTTEGALFTGFTIAGPATKTVLIRGLGPGLNGSPYNSPRPLSRAELMVFAADGELLARNGGWPRELTGVFAQVEATTLATGSADAALLLKLVPGAYSVMLRGNAGSSGEGMVEIFEVD